MIHWLYVRLIDYQATRGMMLGSENICSDKGRGWAWQDIIHWARLERESIINKKQAIYQRDFASIDARISNFYFLYTTLKLGLDPATESAHNGAYNND